jgi:hypothetical protein
LLWVFIITTSGNIISKLKNLCTLTAIPVRRLVTIPDARFVPVTEVCFLWYFSSGDEAELRESRKNDQRKPSSDETPGLRKRNATGSRFTY